MRRNPLGGYCWHVLLIWDERERKRQNKSHSVSNQGTYSDLFLFNTLNVTHHSCHLSNFVLDLTMKSQISFYMNLNRLIFIKYIPSQVNHLRHLNPKISLTTVLKQTTGRKLHCDLLEPNRIPDSALVYVASFTVLTQILLICIIIIALSKST